MKTKTIKTSVGEFVVKQLPMRDLRPCLKAAPDDIADEILRVAVCKDDQVIGDGVDDLCFQDYSQLMTVANELNGLLDEPVKS